MHNTQRRQVGDWIAERYEIFDIRFGGMGEIYISYDHKGVAGQRVLAIKTLKDEYFEDPRFSDRFVNECRTWTKIDRHPNIVRAYSVQELEGRPMVMLELVTGGNLRHWIGTPRLNLPTILRFGIQFCLGLEHAFHKGLHCHRDIKPENLLITDGGSLKITDFGLAKIHDEVTAFGHHGDAIPLSEPTRRQQIIYNGSDSEMLTREQIENDRKSSRSINAARDAIPIGSDVSTLMFANDGSTVNEGLGDSGLPAPDSDDDSSSEWNVEAGPSFTRARAALGTGPYMAPEQFLDAKNVDFSADMYAFGVVLFEMITGERPFKGQKLRTLGRQHLTKIPPSVIPSISKRYSKFARRIDAIVQRCLEKTASSRYPTMSELRRELAECLWEIARERVPTPKETELEAWELTNKGISLGTLHRYTEERNCYHQAISSASHYAPAWFNLAACLGELGVFDKSLLAANVALRINPKSVPALINKGLALCILDKAAEARPLMDQAATLQPHDPLTWYGRGVALLAVGQFSAAVESFGKALKLRPLFEAAAQAQRAAKNQLGLDRVHWARRAEDSFGED